MSAYPPPPPPPMGGQYPPPQYNRQDWKNQRRAIKMQARVQRQQLRMQRRAMRRGSVVGPVVVLALGIVLLLGQTGRLSWYRALSWYGSWWPLVLIGAGAVLLAEWALDQRPGLDGVVRGGRSLGGGVVFLLVLLGVVGVSMHESMAIYNHGSELEDHIFGKGFGGLDRFGEQHDADDQASSAIAPGGTLIVRAPRGDVTVTGSSADGQVHVSVHKQAWAWQESDAEAKEQQLQPVFSTDGGTVTLTVAAVDGGQADLTVELPQGVGLTLQADHGDVNVSSVNGPVSISANHGDVELGEITGNVNAHINNDNSSLTGHNLNGTLLVEGRAGDITLTDLVGDLTLQGDFFGTTHLEHVNGLVRFESSRTKFAAQRLDGELDIEKGELQASEVLGPVSLTSKDKDVTLDRVQGSVQIANSGKGDVSVSSAAPLAGIQVQNEHGSVDVGVPEGAGFILNAQAHRGDVENDFGLAQMGSEALHTADGTVGRGGPAVTITTVGDVTVRKSSVAPLPPALPKPAPAPAPGKLPKMPPMPKAPKPPSAPAAPASLTF